MPAAKMTSPTKSSIATMKPLLSPEEDEGDEGLDGEDGREDDCEETY